MFASMIGMLILIAKAISDHRPPRDVSDLAALTTDMDRAAAVMEAFGFSWRGYCQHAFLHDELHPRSNTLGFSRNDWGATAVDALDTAILMENYETVNQIMDFIPTIDFSYSNSPVSVFETNIRYLGGMMSAYDLLESGRPFSHLVRNPTNVGLLLKQCKKLGDYLSIAFDTQSGLPRNALNFTNKTGHTIDLQDDTVSLADGGTLVLDWTHLSDLLSNNTYADLAHKAESHLLDPRPALSLCFPGLVGEKLNVTTGFFTEPKGSWGGSSDSYYEYLLKMYIYDPSTYGPLKDAWIQAADSAMQYLAMACFAGGNFILGGHVLNKQKHIDFGLELTSSCYASYNATATGIGPETFRWYPKPFCSNITNATTAQDQTCTPKPSGNTDFLARNGFYITDSTYNLRPEVKESLYYAYRFTRANNTYNLPTKSSTSANTNIFKEQAWQIFTSLSQTARVCSGFNLLANMDTPGGDSGVGDTMDSYFLSETLKYSYANFALYQDGVGWPSVDKYGGKIGWVWNTEGHPLKVGRRIDA